MGVNPLGSTISEEIVEHLGMRMQFDRWGALRARVQSEALKPEASIRAANPLGSIITR